MFKKTLPSALDQYANLKVSTALHKKLKVESAKQSVTLRELTEQALLAFLRRPKDPTPGPETQSA